MGPRGLSCRPRSDMGGMGVGGGTSTLPDGAGGARRTELGRSINRVERLVTDVSTNPNGPNRDWGSRKENGPTSTSVPAPPCSSVSPPSSFAFLHPGRVPRRPMTVRRRPRSRTPRLALPAKERATAAWEQGEGHLQVQTRPTKTLAPIRRPRKRWTRLGSFEIMSIVPLGPGQCDLLPVSASRACRRSRTSLRASAKSTCRASPYCCRKFIDGDGESATPERGGFESGGG
jgi:hypothetical protein